MHGRGHQVGIKAHGQGLMISILRYGNEVRPAESYFQGITAQPKPDAVALAAPAGKHDDQVDALGLVGQLLDQMVPGPKPKAPEKPKPDSGYRPFSLAERPLDWMVF